MLVAWLYEFTFRYIESFNPIVGRGVIEMLKFNEPRAGGVT